MTEKRQREDILKLIKPHVEQFPVVTETTCIEVRVPAHISYVNLLQGFVAQMTNFWAYQGPRADRKQRAAIMQKAYDETDWGPCMNCEEMTDCITPLLDALELKITNNILNQITYGTQTPGVPMTGEESASNLSEGTNTGCNKDILWSQCLQLVQFTNQAIVDVLEQVEVATNVVELAGLIDAIPILGFIAKALGTEAVTDTLNYFQEAVLEQYQAQYTTEVENGIACELFCLCRADCVLSVDDVFSLFESRLSSLIPESPTDLIDLIDIMAGLDFDGTEVVDVCFYFAWGAAKLAQFLFGEAVAIDTFNQITSLAVNDANNDWVILCACAIDWNHILEDTDFPAPAAFPTPGFGSITGTTVTQTTDVLFSQDVTGIYIEIQFAEDIAISGVRINATGVTNVEGAGVVNRFYSLLDASNAAIEEGELPIQNGDWEVFNSHEATGVRKIVIQYLFLGTSQTMTFDPIQFYGTATNPFA